MSEAARIPYRFSAARLPRGRSLRAHNRRECCASAWSRLSQDHRHLTRLSCNALRNLYQQGRNLAFEFIQATNSEDDDCGNRDLVRRGVDILVAPGPEIALKSALAASNTLPIVMLAIDYDPIALGYVTSLARPSGNVSGIFLRQIELTTKRLQVVKDAFPDVRAATAFWDWISADQWRAAQSTAPKLGFQLFGAELGEQPYDYEKALAQAPPDYRGWVFVMTSPFLFRDRALELPSSALRHRVAAVFAFREWVDAGGLFVLRPEFKWDVPAGRGVRRPDRARRQAVQFADRTAHEIRVRPQPQDRDSNRYPDSYRAPAGLEESRKIAKEKSENSDDVRTLCC